MIVIKNQRERLFSLIEENLVDRTSRLPNVAAASASDSSESPSIFTETKITHRVEKRTFRQILQRMRTIVTSNGLGD